MNLAYLIVLVAMLSLVGIANADLEEKLTISVSLKTNGDHPPIISGYIKDENGQPVGNVAVQISSSLETAEVNSDVDGLYVYNMPATPNENKFSVSVKAQKEGYQAGYANTSFYINGVEQPIDNTSQETSISYANSDTLKNDPIAQKILQQIEMNKQKEAERQKKLDEIAARERFIEEQRQIANQNLLNDLGGWFVQFDPFNPRNAFASFATQFDEGLQSIYWGQFNFTESKTNDGLAAFQQVLDAGGSIFDAKRAFYGNASISQDEMNDLNNDLNAKYAKNNTSVKTNSSD